MVEIRRSTIIDAPIEDVWAILRDFNGHDRWHPAVSSSFIEGGDPVDAVGAVRRFRLADGSELREQLLSLSDRERCFTYCILEAPLPLMGYVAQVALKPVTDGNRTFWEWRSTFHPPENRRRELTALVSEQIYEAGFEAIRQITARGRAPSPDGRPRDMQPQALRAAQPSVPAPHEITRPRAGGRAGEEEGTQRTQAIVVDRYGGPEVLVPREIDVASPGRDEIRIRHRAVAVNFIDVYCRTGYFDLLTPPGIPGMEAAGIVDAVGENVRGFSIGDRVAYACPPVGAYCGLRTMSPDLVVHLPPEIGEETAAAGFLKGVSASFLLHDVHAGGPGDVVLIHAAAGGVGQMLVQWARHLGATVMGTVSTEEKARTVEELGAHHVIVYSREDFVDAVMRLTRGRGADVIYDAVGRDTIEGSMRALATRGHLVSFGQASGPVGSWDLGSLSSKSMTLSRPNYAHYTSTPDDIARHSARFFAALRQGALRIASPTRFPLAEAAQAHRHLESRASSGSLVLTV